MEDKLIWCNTKEKLKKVAQKLKDDGFSITDAETIWKSYEEELVLSVHTKYKSITYCSRDWYKERGYSEPITADEFLGNKKNPSIVIFRRDRNVIAKDVATGNEGIAKCSPNDDFVFKTGASIALARLMAKTPDALSHDVKDEWIKVLGLTPVEKKVYTDADRNLNVGDKVTIRQWDDMKKTGRQDRVGNIFDLHSDGCFSTAMKSICGKEVTLIEKDHDNNERFRIAVVINGYLRKWWVRTWMIERFVQKPTPKFKVGDSVTLKEGLTVGKMYGSLMLWSGRMYDIANGKRLEVESVRFCEDDGMYHYHCKTTYHDRYYYTEAMLDKWDESKICEGDTVKVINTGLNYSSYPRWVGKHISDPYMAARYCYGSPNTESKYKVIKIAEHENNGRMLAFIEECNGLGHNKCYLIEVKGLEKV